MKRFGRWLRSNITPSHKPTRNHSTGIVLAVGAVGVLISGCANMSTISRTTPLPGDRNNLGKAIHLDAQQRVVYAKSFGVVCAEPSPDAIQAIAASLGLGVSVPQGGQGSLAGALGNAVSSIGLRTQSVQLMRDALYRVCEMYYGKGLNGPMVMQLHQRYQDILVALLAIEQLTGAVKADQSTVNANSSSGAGTNTNNGTNPTGSTNSTANTTTGGSLATPTARPVLSDAAAAHVSQAVTKIVLSAIAKDRTPDACIAFLTNPKSVGQPSSEKQAGKVSAQIVDLCQKVVLSSLIERKRELDAKLAQ